MRCMLLALVFGCGGGSTEAPDARPVDAPQNPATCLIAGSYGDLGTKTGTTAMGPSTLTITLDAGPPRDSFFLQLNSGKGVFAAGLATGTFQLTGAELDRATCGVCVNIIADIVTGQGPSKFYFATAGTVTLTSHTPPAGTLSNIAVHEVTAGGQPIASGCTGSITSMSFAMQ